MLILYVLGGQICLVKGHLWFMNKKIINCRLIMILFIINLLENLYIIHNKELFAITQKVRVYCIQKVNHLEFFL